MRLIRSILFNPDLFVEPYVGFYFLFFFEKKEKQYSSALVTSLGAYYFIVFSR